MHPSTVTLSCRSLLSWGPLLVLLTLVCRDVSADDEFIRGDVNGDATCNLSDAIEIVRYLFQGSGQISCLDSADADDDGKVRLTDAIYLLNGLFRNGISMPEVCETDGTLDELPDCTGNDSC